MPIKPQRKIPTPAAVERIAAVTDPVVRNLQITQCYHELSAAFVERTGAGANWCTFATWASKQAGQSIRKEDLTRSLEALLGVQPEMEMAFREVVALATQLGTPLSAETIRKTLWHSLTAAAVERTGAAIARGNKKVFEEIGWEFARFIMSCLSDTAYDEANLKAFCRDLRPGEPPAGQQYLRQAFTRYYQSLFETDRKKQAELRLLANLEIGYHEQTRLQPEIAEALDIAMIHPNELKTRLLSLLFPNDRWQSQARLLLLEMLGKTSLLDRALQTLVSVVRQQIRLIVTEHLMTMAMPNDIRLPLGQDLTAGFPVSLRELYNADLRTLLGHIDPTPDSLLGSGAVDWADLPDRLHFIADLFRCFHESADLFLPPFLAEQVVVLKAGGRPGGRL
ncbi:hypothetical protein [Larkinella soli]|uniref:hypothetical protein n=1 Tax=Larkinella soli TaxID=1770527 RepID=UPI000FFB2736|nr:hypothetical protein [Larkinella soli]